MTMVYRAVFSHPELFLLLLFGSCLIRNIEQLINYIKWLFWFNM